MSLAGRVISSHYADPVEVELRQQAVLRKESSEAADAIGELAAGDTFRLLDCKLGWAWGYAPDGRVGYVPGAAIGLD